MADESCGARSGAMAIPPASDAVDDDEKDKASSLYLLKEVLSSRAIEGMNQGLTGEPLSPAAALPRTVPVPIAAPVSPAIRARAGSMASTGHPTWLQVDVTSPDAFQRVVMEGHEVLSAESKTACRLLRRALALREKHSYRKPEYYMGSCSARDYVDFVPASKPLPERDEIGSPLTFHSVAVPAAAVACGGSSRGTTPLRPTGPRHAHVSHDPLAAEPMSPTGRTPLVGDALVSHSTGKSYPPGMFYRRRPEPPFVPFQAEVPPPLAYVARMRAGLFHVYPRHSRQKGKDERQWAGRESKSSECVQSSTGSIPHAHSIGLSLDREGETERHNWGMGLGGASRAGVLGAVEELTGSSGEEESAPSDDAHFGDGTDPYDGEVSLFPVHSWEEWAQDYAELLTIVSSPPVRTFAYRRLQLLEMRFDMHRMLNRDREAAEQKAVPHRDFFNCRRVDTHVHHSACMNQKHLLRFIKSKLKKEADTVVIQRDGRKLTLAQVFTSLNLTAYDLSLDVLDMHADWTVAHRFDRFNTKYNPLGQSRLREIFLKTDNLIAGRFLAELTKEVFEDLEATKYSLAEYRLSIYGRGREEWRKLAQWVVSANLGSSNVRWMIQVPRLYEAMRAAGQVACFGDMLENIFAPLFEVTMDPAADPALHQFLTLVGGFDSVDDESKAETGLGAAWRDLPPPDQWTSPEQPPYFYQTYYMAANLAVLNLSRRARGLTEFSFRPHSGEAGAADHLAATFLTAESIAHGINLRRAPVLEYLYYLAQIGIAVSPLSNNRLFLDLSKSPFPSFFSRGLNVSLSTDDPLMLHLTREPLMEEYAVAMQVWHLASADICEIARNSCLTSSFEHPFLSHWLGPDYRVPGPDGNSIARTNVPYIRLQYRLETLQGEFLLLEEGAQSAFGLDGAPMLSKQSSAALFVANRRQQPHVVPHSPGSGRPLYRVVRRGSTERVAAEPGPFTSLAGLAPEGDSARQLGPLSGFRA